MSKTKKRVSRRVQAPTVWKAMNEPVVEVTDEAARAIFLVAAVFFLAIWIMPYLGDARTAYADIPQVAGVEVESVSEDVAITPAWYANLSDSVSGIGQYVEESFVVPFGQAIKDIFDVSDPISQTVAYYQPGVSAVWNAWLELMADPAY